MGWREGDEVGEGDSGARAGGGMIPRDMRASRLVKMRKSVLVGLIRFFCDWDLQFCILRNSECHDDLILSN
jgi:hypothetical protein